jgi:hypothetical protein
MKSLWRLLFVVCCLAPVTSRGVTSDVFRLKLTLSGVIQSGPFSNSIIEKVKINEEDLVNLAQGRTLGTPVPANEILAFANDCLTRLRLIVYDSSTSQKLVTIGEAVDLSTAVSSRRKYEETMHAFAINNTTPGGAGSNGIVGGSFYYHGKNHINTNFCPTSFGGQLMGVLRTVFPYIATNIFCTNYIDSITLTKCATNCTPICVVTCKTNVQSHSECWTNTFNSIEILDVIVPRAPLNTGKKIGTLVEP